MIEKIMNWWNGLPWETVSFSDWIQVIIGLASLLITVILTVVIYRMQSRHEQEIDRLDQKRHEEHLANQADQFLIDNASEIDYLPWCVLASNLHRHEKHTRKIYTAFCRCSNELQNKILEVSNYDFRIITDGFWLDRALEDLEEDIQNHDLGGNLLYDNAKYLRKAFTDYREREWENLDFKEIFEPIIPNLGPSSFFKKKYDSLEDYIQEYFYFRYSEVEPRLYNGNPTKPIDYLIEYLRYIQADGAVYSAWVMELVKEISLVVRNNPYNPHKTSAPEMDFTDAESKTYEDHYYETLQALYNTYYSEKA